MSTIGVKAIKYPDGDSAINITDGGNVTLAGTLGVTGVTTMTSITVGDGHTIGNQSVSDNLEIKSSSGENIVYNSHYGGHIFYNDGTEHFRINDDGELRVTGTITKSSGDLTIDVAGDINIDADGGDVNFKDGGTTYGFLAKYNNDLWIGNSISDGDVSIRGNDGGSGISAVTFDMSDAGRATFNHHINLGDSKVAYFGAGQDLQIFHDGNNSYIDDAGTGALILRGNNRIDLQRYTGETMGSFNADGAVHLYHNNVKKLETTSEGADVIGDEKQHKKGDGTSANREIKAFFSRSVGTNNQTIFTVDTGSMHAGYYYEMICYAGDWSGHSSARVIKRGFINGYNGYTGHSSIENAGPYASNIIENISWNGTTGETTYQLRLDTGSVVLTGMVRIVGTISGFTITN